MTLRLQHADGLPRPRSKCINCGERRMCIKVEARAPLACGPMHLFNHKTRNIDFFEYEGSGPMVEICRACLRGDIGTLAKYLLEGL